MKRKNQRMSRAVAIYANNHTECETCGSTRDIVIHHKIPVVNGGTDDANNLVALCSKCHTAIHFGKNSSISHGQLSHNGIVRAIFHGEKEEIRKISMTELEFLMCINGTIGAVETLELIDSLPDADPENPRLYADVYLKYENELRGIGISATKGKEYGNAEA